MFVGKQDDLATPKDTQWARDQIKTTIHYEELDNFDHGSFMLGKDMSFMKNVLKIVAQQVEVDRLDSNKRLRNQELTSQTCMVSIDFIEYLQS